MNRIITKIIIMLLTLLAVISCDNHSVDSGSNNLSNEYDIVVRNINVIPMDREIVLKNRNVYIRNGKIVKIDSSSSQPVSAKKIIDGSSKFLLPGLADMHVHIWNQIDGYTYLANGITTIRNLWGIPWHLEYQKMINSKAILGPEFHTSGPLMDGNPPVWEGALVVDTPEKAALSVIEQKSLGYEEIKVYDNIDLPVYQEIIKTAKQLNIPVVGHVPNAVGIETVLRSGQKSIEHLDFYNLDAATDSEEQLTVQQCVWNCPTLVMWDKWNRIEELKTANIEELKYVYPEIIADWMEHTVMVSSQKKLQNKLKTLFQHGAKIVAGTDAWAPFVIPGFSLHEEFLLMNQAGLTPYQILQTATCNAADFLGTKQRSGTIETGKDADLIILSANPLEDIKNAKKPIGVIVKGRYLQRSELDSLLNKVSEIYAKKRLHCLSN